MTVDLSYVQGEGEGEGKSAKKKDGMSTKKKCNMGYYYIVLIGR